MTTTLTRQLQASHPWIPATDAEKILEYMNRECYTFFGSTDEVLEKDLSYAVSQLCKDSREQLEKFMVDTGIRQAVN
jgi:hypothetical protein